MNLYYVIIANFSLTDLFIDKCFHHSKQVCILVKDCENVPSRMDGKPYDAGKFAFSLRKALMMVSYRFCHFFLSFKIKLLSCSVITVLGTFEW